MKVSTNKKCQVKNTMGLYVVLIAHIFVSTAALGQSTSAWETPQWKLKKPLANSLLFDQSFDQESFRPFPLAATPTIPTAQPLKKEASNEILPSAYVLKQIVEKPVVVAQKTTPPVTAAAATPLAPVPEKIEPIKIPVVTPPVVIRETKPASIKFEKIKPKASVAYVVAIDENSLLSNQIETLPGVTVHWINERSGLKTLTNKKGVTHSPYPNSHSIRFIAKAPGFLPALGYAVAGIVTPVVMVPENKVPALFKTLGLTTEPGRINVVGRILDRNFKPLKGFTIETSSGSNTTVHYSAGPMGLFLPTAKHTGAMGDFIVSGLQPGLQYLMPTRHLDASDLKSLVDNPMTSNRMQEWPAFIGSFEDSFGMVSVTIQEGTPSDLQTQVVDAFELIRPEAGVYLTIGGQSGLQEPDQEGYINTKNFTARSSVDIVEVQAQGYRKNWISSVANKENFPNFIPLFTEHQLQTVFSPVFNEVALYQGMVIGTLRPEKFRSQLVVQIYDSRGRKNTEAKTFYFDSQSGQKNKALTVNGELEHTDKNIQSFAVTNLADGEWHLVATDAKSGKGVAVQVVRVESGTITQIQL